MLGTYISKYRFGAAQSAARANSSTPCRCPPCFSCKHPCDNSPPTPQMGKKEPPQRAGDPQAAVRMPHTPRVSQRPMCRPTPKLYLAAWRGAGDMAPGGLHMHMTAPCPVLGLHPDWVHPRLSGWVPGLRD